ncbi:MAG TPA: choice-of-anchor J domain-containing protein [Pyrinomonadaceae bacterium]|nr:choice-of-anchor J domain-containing protein [Pyrinomonadaceae bacterium]
MRVVNSIFVLILTALVSVYGVGAQSFSENFDTVMPSGWSSQNNSVAGATGWFAGNTTVFGSQAGAASSYIGANFQNTTGANTISNWLISPIRVFRNGDTIRFYTRTVTTGGFPDRLQLRLSLAGDSVRVGSSATSVGDFTTLLLDINPTYTTTDYPTTWTQYTATISGLAANTAGRVAFRYFVENGGPLGVNSDYIGIDSFQYTSLGPTSGTAFVAGRILTPEGNGLRNAVVSVTDQTGQTISTRTGSFGYFRFDGIESGQSVVLIVNSKRFHFDPVVLNVNGSIFDLEVTGQDPLPLADEFAASGNLENDLSLVKDHNVRRVFPRIESCVNP